MSQEMQEASIRSLKQSHVEQSWIHHTGSQWSTIGVYISCKRKQSMLKVVQLQLREKDTKTQKDSRV